MTIACTLRQHDTDLSCEYLNQRDTTKTSRQTLLLLQRILFDLAWFPNHFGAAAGYRITCRRLRAGPDSLHRVLVACTALL